MSVRKNYCVRDRQCVLWMQSASCTLQQVNDLLSYARRDFPDLEQHTVTLVRVSVPEGFFFGIHFSVVRSSIPDEYEHIAVMEFVS